MNLHHLLVFHTIAKTGSITSSSKQLNISQPALSRELRVLENRFGVTLFERLPRGMRLTNSGKILAEYADRLFEIAHAAELAMKDIASASTGHLSLAASNTIGTYVLPRMISKFCNSNPGIKVSVFVGNTAQVFTGDRGTTLLARFHRRTAPRARVNSHQIRRRHTSASRSCRASSRQFARCRPVGSDDEPLLMRELGSGTRELITDILHGLKIVEGPVMEFGNTEAIKQAVIHDAGIAWLPALSIRTELENGALVPLASDQLTIRRSLNVIRRDSSPGSPANDAFIRLLIQ